MNDESKRSPTSPPGVAREPEPEAAREAQGGEGSSRREVLVKAAMGGGLVAAYGVLAVQGLLFLVPRRDGPPTQLIFIGRKDEFPAGAVKTVHDLEGRAVLIRREEDELVAFSSVCPHLGCQVHWQEDEERFFCPCHRGLFDEDGVAYGGPPGEAGQRLAKVPLEVDGGVVYLEVDAPEPDDRPEGGAA